MVKIFSFRLRKERTLLLSYSLTFVIFAGVLVWSYEAFIAESELMIMFFSQYMHLLQAMLGVGFSMEEMAASFLGMAWRHPLIVFLFISYGLMRAGRLAGDVESPTGDLIFTLPLPRWQIVLTEFLVLCTGLVIINLLLSAGVYIWSHIFHVEDLPGLTNFFKVFLMSVSFYIMFGSLSLLSAVLLAGRGRAMVMAAGVPVFFYFLDFIVSLQERLAFLQPYTLFYNYQVVEVLSGGGFSLGNNSLFFGLAFFFILMAFCFVERRDL